MSRAAVIPVVAVAAYRMGRVVWLCDNFVQQLAAERARQREQRKAEAFTRALQANRINLPAWLEWIR